MTTPRSHMRTSRSLSSDSETHSGSDTGEWRLLTPPCRLPFVGVGDAEQRRLVERTAEELQANGKAVLREAARNADARKPRQVCADRKDVGEVHLQRILDALADSKRRNRARRHGDDVRDSQRLI